tara:strand:+ start:3018 stop:5477 length:2460 start_codon:yes stop_codon:yes gene_type:complete
MQKKINHLLKLLTLIIFFIISSFFLITISFDEKIEKSVVNSIQKNLKTQLILDDVSFTFFENFPSASVKISNLLILDPKTNNQDTLLFTKLTYVELNLINIFHKRYDLENIIITDAKINIKYNNLNVPNFSIFKNNQETKTLNIKKIKLLNTQLKINHEVNNLNLDWQLHKSKILINNDEYVFHHTGLSNKLSIESLDFLNSKKIDFIAKTEIIKDSIKILNSDLNIENIYLNISGSIFNTNNLNLNVKSKKEKIENILMQLPEHLKIIFSPIIAKGKITFNSNIKGVWNKQKNPFLNMQYEITESILQLKSTPFKLHNLNINGSIDNGNSRNFNSTKIIVKSFKSETENGFVNGDFILNNLNNYFLKCQFKSSWDCNIINQYFENSPFIGLNGRLKTKTTYEGNISFNKSFKLMFLNANHKSDIKLENINFKYNVSPLNFNFKNAELIIEKHKIKINSCLATISETDFNFKGEIQNFVPYLLNSAPKIYINGDLSSTYTNFSELVNLSESNNDEIMPDWIDASTNIDISNLSYKNFIASDINSSLSYKNKNLNITNLTSKALNGNILGAFTLSETNNQLKLISNLLLKKINIRNSFEAFNDFNQTFIKRDHLKGEGSAELYIESYWNSDFVLNQEKLKIKSHLVIEKGELINFKPLESLSSYVSLDELKHVKFSALENTINISNKIITIPTMEVKSSALSVMLSGTHTFNKKINYEITLLLSELLSESFRQKNTSITEFGEEERNGEIFNTIYLKMEGDTENPKISLNKIRFMEDLSNNIKKEKEIINNIIKEDLLKKEKIKKEDLKDIEIEWDPKIY